MDLGLKTLTDRKKDTWEVSIIIVSETIGPDQSGDLRICYRSNRIWTQKEEKEEEIREGERTTKERSV